MSLNLQKKLLLFFVILATVPFVIVGYIQLNLTQNELISSVNDRLSFTTTEIAKEIDRKFENNWHRPIIFMKTILENDDLSAQEKIDSLKEIANFKGYLAVKISVEGVEDPILILQDNYKQKLSDARAKQLFQTDHEILKLITHNTDIHVGTPFYVEETNDWIVSIVSRLDKPIAGLNAILSLKVSVNELNAFVKTHSFNKLGHITLMNANGDVLFNKKKINLSNRAFEKKVLNILKSGTRAVGVTPFLQQDREMLGSYAIPQYVDWVIVVSRDLKLAYLPVTKMIQNLLFWASIGIIFAIFGAQYFAKIISRPIIAIDNVASQVKEGNFDIQVPENNAKDEIGHLTTQFNEMIIGLKEREHVKNIFGRYQSKELVEQLLNSKDALSLGGERKNITLLMTDLRGFTAMSEKHSPEVVISVLNDYFEVMIDIIEKYHGTLNEIIGDALFVLFNAPVELDNHSESAVACALEMQQAMQKVNEASEKKNLPTLEMGIGINCGDVVVGNIGSSKRTKYGVVGADVNLTGRIESYTVGGQVLISESVHRNCTSNLEIVNELRVQPKGVKAMMSIFDVTAIGAPYSIKLATNTDYRTTLTEPLKLSYKTLDGKHLSDKSEPASIIEISHETAIFVCESKLDVLNNLLINIADKDLSQFDIYAKVVKTNNSHVEIRFTAIPDEVKPYFEQLLQSS